MRSSRQLITAHFSRALLTVGLSLAGLSGCQMEAEPPHDTSAEPADTGKVASAVVVTTYDLLANAAGAFWHNNDGGVLWETNDSRGAALSTTGVLENGASLPYLYTHPKLTTNGFMHGAFAVNVPVASQHPSVTATFGFVQGANATDGVTFSITTQVNGTWVTIFSQRKTYTGALTTVTADLTAFAGKSIQLFVNADAGPNSNADWAAWTDLRVVADTATPATGCNIWGTTYAPGAVNPWTSCQVCDPNTNPTGWTIRADSCLIGGTCYAANTTDNLGCRRCDPLVSHTAWTNKSACDSLVVAATNATEDGDFGGVSQADAKCAAEGANLGLPGNWKAMVSSSGARDYKNAVPTVFGSMPVRNLQGQQLYPTWTSLFTNQVWPSDYWMYMFGNSPTSIVGWPSFGKVWTGTGLNGQYASSTGDNNCSNWNSIWTFWPFAKNAITGDFGARKIVNGGETACNESLRFACVLVPPSPVVTTQNYDGSALGDVMGKAQGDSFAFLGIPYAAPPTGSLRFAPPAKATAWSGSRNAFTQGAACPAPPLLPTGGLTGSEDCLYLNVWTPKTATPTSNLPVMFFHHGGAYFFGGSASAGDWLAPGLYDGDRLATAQNAVVVTAQSRHGALGYLADPSLSANATSRTSTVNGGTSGNYGLLDSIQALKWVKKNISKFGGDPSHVMWFGQSSGAGIGYQLLASPLAKDNNQPLFSSMILESGFPDEPSMNYRYTQAASTLETVGCANATDKVACLRAAPLQSFIDAGGALLAFFPSVFNQNLSPDLLYGLTYGPSVDGYVIPQPARLMYAAGTHNKVPVIIGNNKDEVNFMMLFMAGGILTGDLANFVVIPTCSELSSRLTTNLGATMAAQVIARYGCNSSDGLSPTLSYAAAFTHAQWECPVRRSARALTLGQTQPVRRYRFTHGADNIGVLQNVLGLVPQIGAAHTFELPFVFNTHNTLLGYWPSTREVDLGTAIQRYWRAFAASGDPNYSGGVSWPAYVRADDNTLKLEVTGKSGSSDPGIQMLSGVDTDKCDFWDNNFNLDGFK